MASLVCAELPSMISSITLHRFQAFGSSRTNLALPRQISAQVSSIGKESSKCDEIPTSAAAEKRDPAPNSPPLQHLKPMIATKLSELSKFLFSTRKKGDLTDVLLMSISMAVFVYISQQLVCVYCLLRHHHFDLF
ncbi:uncharacterized protein LOC112345243 [Selaginella moellendorffii]|uniref:uncharacterized protein LOC112345243 n=1 Tax=Selaginella moellendorffii TaxID=88036 RepID=UPI000D1C7145|nr:uncharacterized protein LOC112345243 [Selaginella moellendorffii]|eukprot:XP_024527368.1 uncharacterized protein LOC112345243 [Selaginella moellendorffii]